MQTIEPFETLKLPVVNDQQINPLAHLHIPDISMEAVKASPMLWDPIRYLETCPSSDGACAMVLADEDLGQKDVAWVRGTAMRSEALLVAGRDEVSPQAGADCAKAVYAESGIGPDEVDTAEIYVPFSWYEPMWLENLGLFENGWKAVQDGSTALGGKMPINPSGGVMSSNPIGASGLIRFAEAANQVRGRAGKFQVEGAKNALGHAYGGGSQFYSMWMVSSDPG